jgi:hypothetical protein
MLLFQMKHNGVWQCCRIDQFTLGRITTRRVIYLRQGLPARRPLFHSFGFAPRRGHQPGAQTLRLLNAIQVFKQHLKGMLKNVSALIFIQAGAPGYGVDKTLVAGNKLRPGITVAAATGGQ